jgi:hypothetical protein
MREEPTPGGLGDDVRSRALVVETRRGTAKIRATVIPRDGLIDQTTTHRPRSVGMQWKVRRQRKASGGSGSDIEAADTFDLVVDPPFFQRESGSSNKSGSNNLRADFNYDGKVPTAPKPNVAHSSSADEYRSVIDDLTVEIQRLKEELKRYKQLGPDVMKKEKLFELKVHGLPKRKKLELEATLRGFAATLDDTTTSNSASQRKRSSHNLSSDRSMSKHASSSSGSRSRPVDSAYASMSTANNSSGTSLSRPSMSVRQRNSDQKVENYLKDIPEGLYPRHVAMTDKERKKLVVRRLEQLFTGKTNGRRLHDAGIADAAPARPEAQQVLPAGSHPSDPAEANREPNREARIIPPGPSTKKPRSRDNISTSNSNGDKTESGGNGGSHRPQSAGANSSPRVPPAPSAVEQRPTRPRDLDPDRIQIPLENMQYIRHLGLRAPDLEPCTRDSGGERQDVSPDANGWVYLNLLCNLAQLHMINVTPGFIRAAVAEKSAKFQLSPDGRKIRWRGGSRGTKFSSDSSAENSQKSSLTGDSDSSDKEPLSRRRIKMGRIPDDGAALSGMDNDKVSSSEHAAYHYKPLFGRRSPSSEEASQEDKSSSLGPVADSNPSAWAQSRSGSFQRRKRRLDGAIIYYSGAPFCTDLSGDVGDVSPTTQPDSSGQGLSSLTPHTVSDLNAQSSCLPLSRSVTRSTLQPRPVSLVRPANLDMDVETPSSEDVEGDCSWSPGPQIMGFVALEASGLGGVRPDDHFFVRVATRRRKDISQPATVTTAPLSALSSRPTPKAVGVEIEYVTGHVKHLPPVALPPPAMFVPPFSSDGSSDSISIGSDEDEDNNLSSSELTSRRANLRQSEYNYPSSDETSSDDDDEEGNEGEDDETAMNPTQRGGGGENGEGVGMRRAADNAMGRLRGSATMAGDQESGYSGCDDRPSA